MKQHMMNYKKKGMKGMVITNLRKEARETLSGNWGKSAIIIFVETMLIVFMNFIINIFKENPVIRLILSIIQIIVEIPLMVGVTYSFVKLRRKGEIEVFDFIKYAIKNFGRAWKIQIRILLKLIIPIIGIVISEILFAVTIIAEQIGNHNVGLACLIIGIIIYISCMILALIIELIYSQAYILSYDNPEKGAKEIVKESKNLMKGHKIELVLLQLSFLGWVILCIPTFGIGLFWLLPYRQVATISFHDELLKQNGKAYDEEEWKMF